jgi:RNA polymerase sigma factor (sigma-70 family)
MNTPTDATPTNELELLQRWRDGDKAALERLLELLLPWLQAEVRRSMGGQAFGHVDSSDVVQTTVVNFLTWGPRFIPESGAQLRALLKRIAFNELTDQRRRLARTGRHFESLLPSAPSLSGFGPRVPSEQHPAQAAIQDEESNWVRLALQFLDDDDRFLLLASEVENRDWASIAQELGLNSPDSARVRAARLKPKVANLLRRLRTGALPPEAAS